tara:strand:+ start:2146 stop:3045 length:900 start_codon:yes stop_codon:yes gene_type:complete
MKNIYIFTLTLFIGFIQLNAQTIWTGVDYNFTKASNANWTLATNQDVITQDVILTRQNNKLIYNYQWFQTTFNEDASSGDLKFNFWNNSNSGTSTHTFTATGGPKNLKWAIINDTGSTTDWSGFNFYGTVGNSSNFYSFHNIASMIYELESGNAVTAVENDFNINGESGGSATDMPLLVGKKLGVWIEDEDIYFTLTYTNWGSGGSGGAVSYIRSTDQTLSTNAFELNKRVTLHPNPSSDFIQASNLKSKESYRIYNVLGAEIKKGFISNNEHIDIRNFTKGLYFFKFENANTVMFIKE